MLNKIMTRMNPRLIIDTETGSIPFISWNFIKHNTGILFRSESNEINGAVRYDCGSDYLIKVNVGDFLDLNEVSEIDVPSLNEMKLMEDKSLLLSFNDSTKNFSLYKNSRDEIAIPTIHGRKLVSAKTMLNVASKIGSERVQVIADICTPKIAKAKWTNRAVIRSMNRLEETFDLMDSNQSDLKINQKNPIKIWASLTGGYIEESRIKSCEHLTQYSDRIEAIVIEGFPGINLAADDNDDENGSNRKSLDDCLRLLNKIIIPNSPGYLPKSMFGVFFPNDMLRLIDSGIDMLDSSLCTMLTRKGQALPSPLIDTKAMILRFHLISDSNRNESSPNDSNDDELEDPNPTTIIDLYDAKFNKSEKKLSDQCCCHTCSNRYTRAYIHHLLKRHEMNGNMLLQIHNHYSLTLFFDQIRSMNREQFEKILINSNLRNY
ncbi:hypothetical protein NH340_JMT07030 [Sarcoptes scabiei]|nr:hypothetical protein NH340_JMT07030 [Sarcoptes scabiei]